MTRRNFLQKAINLYPLKFILNKLTRFPAKTEFKYCSTINTIYCHDGFVSRLLADEIYKLKIKTNFILKYGQSKFRCLQTKQMIVVQFFFTYNIV